MRWSRWHTPQEKIERWFASLGLWSGACVRYCLWPSRNEFWRRSFDVWVVRGRPQQVLLRVGISSCFYHTNHSKWKGLPGRFLSYSTSISSSSNLLCAIVVFNNSICCRCCCELCSCEVTNNSNCCDSERSAILVHRGLSKGVWMGLRLGVYNWRWGESVEFIWTFCEPYGAIFCVTDDAFR